jgi:hypothetical protein
MQSHILSNNVLTDNILLIADKGKIFKGGYIAIVKEYYFQNAWSDKEVITKFRKLERMKKHIAKYYKEFETDNLTQE